MTAVLAATALLGVVTTASGWFIGQSGRASWSAVCLVLGGVALLLGCAAVVLDLGGAVSPVLRLAGCLLLPLAVLAYPRLAWREPVSFVLLVVVVGAGVLSVGWEDSFELMGFVLVGALLLHVWWALERGDVEDRRALAWSSLAWISAGLAAAFVAFLSESMGAESVPELDAAFVAVLVVGPVAMVVGVVRPEVVDVRGLVTRAVVAATVLIVYVAAAVGVTSAIHALGGEPLALPPTIVLCAVLAFGVRPLQVMLRGVVDQLLFGDRPDPLAAATSLADRIGDDPALALAAVREALVLPYASIRAGGEVLASSGRR